MIYSLKQFTYDDSTAAAATRGRSGQTAAPGLDLIIILSVDRAIELRSKSVTMYADPPEFLGCLHF